MRKILEVILLMLLLVACAEEEIIPIQQESSQPVDRAIYMVDSSASDAFCDFRLIRNRQRCWDQDLEVYQDCHHDLLFTRYGNGWTGADATYSLPLPDGRIMWMFGDTFLGTVRADRSRQDGTLLRNTVVVQQGDALTTLFQHADGKPTAFLSPSNAAEWYWPLDATVHEDEIHYLLGRLGTSGEQGMWDFHYLGFDLAVLDASDFSVKSVENKISDPRISYGSCILEDDQYTYIYGISSLPLQKRAHLARVAGTDLRNEWWFFDGVSWQESPSNFVIANGVSDQFSVIKDGNIYYLITHEIIFGDKIFIAESASPTGPFRNRRVLYCTPESGGNIFTYNTFVHPELSTGDELRISYNINSFQFSDLFENADLYRPRFLRIENWR